MAWGPLPCWMPRGPPAWPAHALHLVNVFPPGGASDVVARFVAQKLADGLGQPVVVDNKPGAATIIGTESLWKHNHRWAAMIVGIAANSAMAAVVNHNAQVLSRFQAAKR